MHPHITVITLGVQNLERAVTFYRDGLGLPTRGIVGEEVEDGRVAFFKLDGGLVLALFPRPALLKDANLDPSAGGGDQTPATFSLAHNVDSKAEVDRVIEEAARAGATVTDPPHAREWGGYSGYFRDPDGFLWEVAWNPSGFE